MKLTPRSAASLAQVAPQVDTFTTAVNQKDWPWLRRYFADTDITIKRHRWSAERFVGLIQRRTLHHGALKIWLEEIDPRSATQHAIELRARLVLVARKTVDHSPGPLSTCKSCCLSIHKI